MVEQLSLQLKDIRAYSLLSDNILLYCCPPQLLFARLDQRTTITNIFDVSINDVCDLNKALENAQREMLEECERTEKCTIVEVKLEKQPQTYKIKTYNTGQALVLKIHRTNKGLEVVIYLDNNGQSSCEYKMTKLREVNKLSMAIASQLTFLFNLSTSMTNALDLFVRNIQDKKKIIKKIIPERVLLNMVPHKVLSDDNDRVALITIIKCNLPSLYEIAEFYHFAEF